ncbi:SDR family oxidoreductase [Pseudoxanthomonas sp. JBR18]|uniref:SDR family oxidoreductase n=1 Tax=Pseudoxanthomonas sp. JBR18 TaxID=2969308 RepID=UPI00230567B3|nr:SDR family oxidoreductase [Pseudoxanthomonas sp. JBR18]WCE04843.1 SDR family oxidoreductase [Pseudoxanthomonas sp. JBR18]
MSNLRWRLDGQLALVTGASAGIGLATARELLSLGCDVLLAARDADTLEAARDELTDQFPERLIEGFAADVSIDEERRALLDWVEDQGEGLHILVNAVGATLIGETLELGEDEWRDVFETSLFSAFELCRYAQPLLAGHPATSIVNVGAVSGLASIRGATVEGMAKAALHQMTRSLAAEWAEAGIRVNAVAPWAILTPRTAAALADTDHYEQVLARTPLQRIGEPEEVAAAIAFLCLPAASYITGECIAVDGGFGRFGF